MTQYVETNCNILQVEVKTNCPQGGDSGHGGHTVFELKDLAATDITVIPIQAGREGAGGVRLEFGGDTECETLIKCLRFAADELERQWRANGGRPLQEAPGSGTASDPLGNK